MAVFFFSNPEETAHEPKRGPSASLRKAGRGLCWWGNSEAPHIQQIWGLLAE